MYRGPWMGRSWGWIGLACRTWWSGEDCRWRYPVDGLVACVFRFASSSRFVSVGIFSIGHQRWWNWSIAGQHRAPRQPRYPLSASGCGDELLIKAAIAASDAWADLHASRSLPHCSYMRYATCHCWPAVCNAWGRARSHGGTARPAERHARPCSNDAVTTPSVIIRQSGDFRASLRASPKYGNPSSFTW